MHLRPVLGAAAVALGVSALAAGVASADPDPAVRPLPATAITDTAATLNGITGPQLDFPAYRFQYGIARYDHSTPVTQRPGGEGQLRVSMPVTGLQPATTYQFRLVAGDGNPANWTYSGDQTFTTAPTPPPLPAGVAPTPVATTTAAPAPRPALGQSVVVAPVSGTVKVKAPRAAGYVALRTGASIPTGAAIDTRAGKVALTTALPGGNTQTGQFRGGVFRVRQSAKGGGTTDIDLRGPAPTCARSNVIARAAATATRRPPRKLWASDKGGRFRTHGRNSVTTVRGTKWVTTDSCAGTRTTVTEGAVSVRDLKRKRTVLVRAGHTYLARTR